MAVDITALDQLKELIGGDQDALHELINSFLVEGDDLVSQMEAACDENNLEILNRAAHSVKANAADFGAASLTNLCSELEKECNQGWPEDAKSKVAMIKDEFLQVQQSLRNYIDDA